MNSFGGNWTEQKIDILVEYSKAYLTIMNKYANKFNWKLMYFDGFAGSGLIVNKLEDDSGQQLIFDSQDEVEEVIIGAAKRILEIDQPRSFDDYYFVEKDKKNFDRLEENTANIYPNKKIHLANTDCNEKMLALRHYLQGEGKDYKVLAYIDPCGMQLNWESLHVFAHASIDMWVLIPTGMGVNRMLTTNGQMSEAWLDRLETFLGMDRNDLKKFFYEENTVLTLFDGEEKVITKRDKAIERSEQLYRMRLGEIFDFVSTSYVLRTKSNTVLYHFLMVSNNATAVNIANDIIERHKLQ